MWKIVFNWFITKAWPMILVFIQKYERQITEIIFAWVKDAFKKREKATNEEFKGRAEEAEQKAEEATDADSKIKYQAQAEAYREAARILEEQNKKLREELEETKLKVQREVEKNTSSLKAKDLFNTSSAGEITVKPKDNYIHLPPPKD